MPIVDIKGVGKAQFPDGMSAENIREFLRAKYSQQLMNGESDLLTPVDNIAAPYEPTLAERMGQGVSDTLSDAGLISDRYGAQRVGENLSTLGEFLPGVGDATAGDEFGRAAHAGSVSGMALAGLGAIPVVGDLAKRLSKADAEKWAGLTGTWGSKPTEAKASSEFGSVEVIDASYGNPGGKQVNAKDADGNIIGTLYGSPQGDGSMIGSVEVRPDKRREGVATKMYDYMEEVTGQKMKPASKHSKDAQGFWGDRIKPQTQLSTADALPMDKIKDVTSFNDMFDFTPEQMAQQLRSSKPENVIDGVYIEPTKFGEKRFNPDGSIEIVKDGEVLRKIEPQDSDMAYKNKIMKNEGEKPEVKAAQEKRKADFDAEMARQRAQEEDTYKMQHTAPTREDNPAGDDLTDTFGTDIYTGNALQYFGTGSSFDNKAIRIIQGMKGKPEKVVTIYRAVPKDVKSINSSDWVTTTKEYAQGHMEGEEGWHILSKKVKAKDIATDGNSIHEFGYDPVE